MPAFYIKRNSANEMTVALWKTGLHNILWGIAKCREIIAWFCLCITMQEEVQKKVTEENRQRFNKFFRKDNQDDDQGGSGPANMCGGGVGNNWDSGRFIF